MSGAVSSMTSKLKNISLRKDSNLVPATLHSANPYSLLDEQALGSNLSLVVEEDEEDPDRLELTDAPSTGETPKQESLKSGANIEGKGDASWNVVQRNKNRNSRYDLPARPAIDVRDLDTWRNGNGGPSATAYQPAHNMATRNSRMFAYGSKFPHLKGARTLGGVSLDKIKPGVIMWRLDTRPCSDPNIQSDDPGLFFGPAGEKYHRKGRYWVVLYRCRDHVMEVPIYTFKNTGLARKPEKLRDTYNSIQPPNNSGFVNQNPGQMVLEIANVVSENESFRNTMVVHLNEIWSHSNDVLEARVVAELTVKSTDELIRRTRAFIGTYTDD